MSLELEEISANVHNIFSVPICSVCFDILYKDLAVTPCGHVFHNHCIEQCIRTSQKCPNDRNYVYDVTKIKFDLKRIDSLNSFYPSTKLQDDKVLPNSDSEMNTTDKLREITNFITKFKIESEAKEEALRNQIALNEKLQNEKENIAKELETSSKQNNELRKRIISYKNKCEGYEDEINNLKIEFSEKEEAISTLRKELEISTEKLKKIESLNDIQSIIDNFNNDTFETTAIIDDLINRANGLNEVKLFAHKLEQDHNKFSNEIIRLKEENKQLKEEIIELKDICFPPERKKKSIASYGAIMIQEIPKEKTNENKLKPKEIIRESQVIENDMIELEIVDNSKVYNNSNKIAPNNKSGVTFIDNPFVKQKTKELHTNKFLTNLQLNSMSSTGKQNKLVSLLTRQMSK